MPNYSLKRTAAYRRLCYHAVRGSGRLAQALARMIRKLLISLGAYFLGFFALGASYGWFEVFVTARYNRLMGQSFAFQFSVLATLAGAVICSSCFTVFLLILRTSPPALACVMLGALGWSLIYGGGLALGGVVFPSVKAFLLLFGSPLVTAALGYVVALQRNQSANAG